MNEGLFKVFAENFPITDARNNFVLEFLDYYIDPPRYSIEECIERGLTYSVPLKAKLKLPLPRKVNGISECAKYTEKTTWANGFLQSVAWLK